MVGWTAEAIRRHNSHSKGNQRRQSRSKLFHPWPGAHRASIRTPSALRQCVVRDASRRFLSAPGTGALAHGGRQGLCHRHVQEEVRQHDLCLLRDAVGDDGRPCLRAWILPGSPPRQPAESATCQPCNKAKSDLEHYLATVLPFGGRHADAAANLQGKVPRRLAKNLALHRKLAAGMSRVWTREAGVYLPTSTVPFEPEKLNELFAFVAKGLAWRHWGVLITPDAAIWAGILNGTGERLLRSWMTPAKVRVTGNPGGGTFSYEGVQASDNPSMTIWLFSVYGGARLSGDPDAPDEEVSKVGAVSGSKRFVDWFRSMIGEQAVA
jgi:hypothetical protein